MITKSTFYKDDKPEDGKPRFILEFPELDTINLGDPDVQKQLIKWGCAVGMPGGEIIMTKNVKMIAGGTKS